MDAHECFYWYNQQTEIHDKIKPLFIVFKGHFYPYNTFIEYKKTIVEAQKDLLKEILMLLANLLYTIEQTNINHTFHLQNFLNSLPLDNSILNFERYKNGIPDSTFTS